MKSIRRLSLALIMFSLFSVSYIVTSVTAQTAVAPTGTAPDTGTPGMPPTGTAPDTGTPGMPPTGTAPDTGTPGMPPTGTAPDTGTPGMPPTGTAPDTGTPGMPPTGTAPDTGTPESGGISGWIKDGLKSLGIGDGPTETTPASESSAVPPTSKN
jgi:serine protease